MKKRTNDKRMEHHHFSITTPQGHKAVSGIAWRIKENEWDLSMRCAPKGPTPAAQRSMLGSIVRWGANSSFLSGEMEARGGVMDIVGEKRRKPLLALVALQEFGTAAKIAEDIVAAKMFIATVSDQSVVPVLEEKVAQMEQTRKGVEAAEKILAKMGRKIDPKTGRAVLIAKGHRGKDLLVECVEDIFSVKYKDEYPEVSLIRKRAIRREIKNLLTPLIDEKELSPESRAPIDNAIRNWIKRTL